jgi:hypothetical protein
LNITTIQSELTRNPFLQQGPGTDS